VLADLLPPGDLGHQGVVSLDLGAGALALMEEGVRLVNDHHRHHQRPRRRRPHMPGVGHPEDVGDGGLAEDHQPVHPLSLGSGEPL